MQRLISLLFGITLLAATFTTRAETSAATPSLQEQINLRYSQYFRTDSQSLLPFPSIELQDWKKLRATRDLKRIYTEPDKYYNSKVYTLTLYQATDDGSYFLDAKGGFWGMDELIYGPLQQQDLEMLK